jgi:hypothetical protein
VHQPGQLVPAEVVGAERDGRARRSGSSAEEVCRTGSAETSSGPARATRTIATRNTQDTFAGQDVPIPSRRSFATRAPALTVPAVTVPAVTVPASASDRAAGNGGGGERIGRAEAGIGTRQVRHWLSP